MMVDRAQEGWWPHDQEERRTEEMGLQQQQQQRQVAEEQQQLASVVQSHINNAHVQLALGSMLITPAQNITDKHTRHLVHITRRMATAQVVTQIK
jgi:hypothetical protein